MHLTESCLETFNSTKIQIYSSRWLIEDWTKRPESTWNKSLISITKFTNLIGKIAHENDVGFRVVLGSLWFIFRRIWGSHCVNAYLLFWFLFFFFLLYELWLITTLLFEQLEKVVCTTLEVFVLGFCSFPNRKYLSVESKFNLLNKANQ